MKYNLFELLKTIIFLLYTIFILFKFFEISKIPLGLSTKSSPGLEAYLITTKIPRGFAKASFEGKVFGLNKFLLPYIPKNFVFESLT